MSYDTYSYTMRIVGRNKKGQKILITVPDLDDPAVIMEAARAAQSAARMSAVLATVNQASADGSGDGEGSSPGSTPTPTPTATPTPTPTATSAPTPTPTATSTPSPTPTATPLDPTATPTPTPTATPTPSPTPTATSSPTPTPTVTPTPTPTPDPGQPIPSDPNLEVWYNATNSTNFNPSSPSDGTYLTSWTNSGTVSTHDANASGNTGVKPRYQTAIQNGLPAIYFDGNNDLFTINPWTVFQNIQNYTYFIVLKTNQPAVNQYVSVMKNNTTEVKDLYLANQSSQWNIGAAGGIATSPSVVDTNFHIFSIAYDGTQTNGNVALQNAARLKMRIDSIDQSLTFSSNVNSTTDGTTTYWYLGTDIDANNDFDGYVGEIIVYVRTLTSVEIQDTENYLKAKWGIVSPTPTPTPTPTVTPTPTPTPEPVTANLVLHYDPSNPISYAGSGTTINDLSGNGLNGTMSDISFTSPYFTYNGLSSQISVTDNPLLEPGSGNWTMEAWVHQSVTGNDVVLGKFDSGGSSQDVGYSIRTTANTFYAQFGDGTGTFLNSSNYTSTINTWFQIVYVFKTGAIKTLETFVNGSTIGTVNHTLNSILNNPSNLYVGSYNGGEYSQWFDGRIGIVRLYNDALSAAEVLQNFNADKSKYGL